MKFHVTFIKFLFLDIDEKKLFLDVQEENSAIAFHMIFRVEHVCKRSFPTSLTSAKFIQSATRSFKIGKFIFFLLPIIEKNYLVFQSEILFRVRDTFNVLNFFFLIFTFFSFLHFSGLSENIVALRNPKGNNIVPTINVRMKWKLQENALISERKKLLFFPKRHFSYHFLQRCLRVVCILLECFIGGCISVLLILLLEAKHFDKPSLTWDLTTFLLRM